MRITNKIMQRNNLSNINTNKVYQDKLSTQMSTEKKINRPSDDPVVAIRALRLRSNVTEVTQYYSKNIPDAESWLDVTEGALNTLTGVITKMIDQCTRGSNGDLTTVDRQTILEQLKALSKEVYSTGDADYAGRYVFTGYRTDTPLSFQDAQNTLYTITEKLQNSDISKITKVDTGKLLQWNNANYGSADMDGLTEDSISSADVYRFQLAYNDCKMDGTPSITFKQKKTDADGNVTYEDVTWSSTDATNKIETMHSYDNPYAYVAANKDAIVFVPETGEMLLGENKYNQLMQVKDDTSTVADESKIQVTYQKENWLKGDLRPEHYFYCEADGVKYNEDYLTEDTETQEIEYDVGFNQTIRVNSTAGECFSHGIGRVADDLVSAMQEVLDIETAKTAIENKLKTATGDDAKKLQTQLDAADKAYTLAKDKCQKMFESGITSYQGYLDKANLSVTACGTRSSKLSLIKTRMQNQKTTFETLQSENEDVDITEVIINLKAAELTYQASLMATGKVAQTTLLNYI